MTSTLEQYRRHATDHGLHMMSGDAEASNESHDRLLNTFGSLVRDGNRRELLTLYDDPNPSVQCWAAAHTLELDEAMALEKLEQLERSGIPIVSLNAEYTIKEWKNGNLKFIPT
jgi:hypothetical protein